MEPQEFIIKYCEILDEIHGQRPDRLWFSTWMASKSPYFDFAKKFEAYWLTKRTPPRLTPLTQARMALRLSLTLFSMIGKSWLLRFIYRAELRVLQGLTRINVLRTFESSASAETRDAFWGDLILELEKDPTPLLVIFQPQSSLFKLKQWAQGKKHHLPYQVFLSPGSLIKTYFELLFESFGDFAFSESSSLRTPELRALAEDNYRQELLSPTAFATLCFYRAFFQVIKNHYIEKFFLTYENNPWEKMLYFARRELDKNFKVIGFQHSTIQRDAANYYLSEYEVAHRLHPDVVICSGPAPLSLLKTLRFYKSVPLELGCALRYSSLQPTSITSKPQHTETFSRCLIALDGTPDAGALLEFALKALEALGDPQLEIRVKEHPNFPISRLGKDFTSHPSFRKGSVKLSHEPLAANLDWAQVLLYSGTTVSLEALSQGKPVIQYSYTLFNFDPLFQFQEYKYSTQTVENFVAAWQQLKTLSAEEKFERSEAGKRFVSAYFNPCTSESLGRFLRV
jgi:hypothetical protein